VPLHRLESRPVYSTSPHTLRASVVLNRSLAPVQTHIKVHRLTMIRCCLPMITMRLASRDENEQIDIMFWTRAIVPNENAVWPRTNRFFG
jgi:hypothetical protein